MLALAKKISTNEPEPKKENTMTLDEATNYLKKIKEWESAVKFDRNTIIAWAEFLKGKGIEK
jgi:hypothetical protein